MESFDGFPIQIGRRLIQNVELRPHGIDRGKGQQLLFSARHGKDVPPPQPLQMQAVGGIIQPTEDLAPGHTLVFQAKSQLAVGIQIEKLTFGVLENRTPPAGPAGKEAVPAPARRGAGPVRSACRPP